ncbi:unnamed protein product [Fraxinus pennsylvanica]|uniref:Uncharacterized protein n=1 Tax=Fraxinus pennsylvanica TaxID=56036 RepID=A0AAD2E8J4_9LAMI|nr:unnamed protein product [Fraxinus pennsylvanica]
MKKVKVVIRERINPLNLCLGNGAHNNLIFICLLVISPIHDSSLALNTVKNAVQFASIVIKQSYSNWKFQFLNVMEDQHLSPNSTRDTECKLTITEDEGQGQGEDHHQYFDGRRMHRVPQIMRFNKHDEEDYYAPKMVSFGPYYHGLPELGMAEEFKHEVLRMFVSSSGKDKQFFYCQIFKVIDQIRNCYVGVSRDAYDDGALSEMMLRDAFFTIYLMEIALEDEDEDEKSSLFLQHLGMAAIPFAFRDTNLLENQIPLWVIKLLINLMYGEGSMLLCNYLSSMILENTRLTKIPGEDKKQPLHLLDAYHRLLVEELDNAGKILVQPVNKCQWWPRRKENRTEFGKYNRQFRSVSYLRSKGIDFKPSSYCLKSIRFNSYTFYGQVQLPVWLFTSISKLFFINMIAYETSPENDTGITIICYVNFLKSLIDKPEDVKELREKKILFSTLDSDEQVAKVIKEIDTCGIDDYSIFDDVKTGIEKHYSSKART